MRGGRLHRFTRIASLILGISVLLFSIYWSQDGFNFDLAGDSGYGQMAKIAGWVLAITVTVLELLFSTNLRDLNPTLFILGLGAYAYSIYTNHGGILHFQGASPNDYGAWFLAICVDAAPEPMIAWALGESLTGDVLGNIFGGVEKFFRSVMDDSPKSQKQSQDNHPKPSYQSRGGGQGRRQNLEMGRDVDRVFHQVGSSNRDGNRPNRFNMEE